MCNRLPRRRSWRSFFGLRRVGTGWGGGRGRRGQAGCGVERIAGRRGRGGRRRARGRSRARGGAEDLSSSSETEIESAQPRGLGDASGLWYVVVIDPRVGGGGEWKGDRRSSPIGWSSLPSVWKHGPAPHLYESIGVGREVSRLFGAQWIRCHLGALSVWSGFRGLQPRRGARRRQRARLPQPRHLASSDTSVPEGEGAQKPASSSATCPSSAPHV